MSNTRKTTEQILADCAKRQIAPPEWGSPTKWVTEYDEEKLIDGIGAALRHREAEVARLREALRPFMEKAPDIDGMSGSDIVTLPMLVREVKAARATLNSGKE